jgi:hypothetical protein
MASKRATISIPEEVYDLLERRAKELGYKSFSGYFLGLGLFDAWAKRPHKLTLQIVNEDNEEMRQAVFREIIESYDRPEKPGSYFEVKLNELAKELANKKQ